MTSRVFEIFPVKQSNMIVHDSQALEIFESLQPHGFLTYIDEGPFGNDHGQSAFSPNTSIITFEQA